MTWPAFCILADVTLFYLKYDAAWHVHPCLKKKVLIHKSMIILNWIFLQNCFTNSLSPSLFANISLRIGWYFGVKELVNIVNRDKWQYLTKRLFNWKKNMYIYFHVGLLGKLMSDGSNNFVCTCKQYVALNKACGLNIWFEMLMFTC